MNQKLENVLFGVSQSEMIDLGDLQSASQLIVESICQGLNVERAGIWLLSEDKQAIECFFLLDKATQQDKITLNRQQFPKYFEALDAERIIAAHDACQHMATSEFTEVYLKPQGIESMLDAPIRHGGKMIGIICCEHRGAIRQWTRDEQVFVTSLADLFGRAVNANTVRRHQAELAQLNAQLESTVADRTLKLQQTLAHLKTTQTSLIESEKLAALGNLVAGVAHEVNTPLGIAVTSTSHCIDELNQLKKKFDNDELDEAEFRYFIETMTDGLLLIDRNLSRAAELVHNFKRTSADQLTLEKEYFNLSEYLEQISTPLRPLTRKNRIAIDIQLADNIMVDSYPGAIAQIFTNLVSNCFRHAFPEGFKGDKRIILGAEECGDEIRMFYKDNGIGLNAETKKRIFEPFYTTARKLGGTGLGMSIVYNLVTQKLGGRIALISEVNQGLEIHIFINKK